ncbi:hypothetical protein KAI04_00610 [Candidatus Pacearchaeota archaeon]|nr:hypothetical protein [Candidatus Pacearchaeota archaeon]
MNFNFYLEKLHNSDEYQDFMLENPDAYICSGFFVMDFEKADHQRHLDCYAPTLKKVFSFKLENGIEKVPIETFDNKTPKKLSFGYDFDLDEVEKIIKEKMSEEKIKSRVQKILLSLQNSEGKDLLIATVFVSGLGMIKVNIDPPSKKIIDFDKKSFFDMIKMVKRK